VSGAPPRARRDRSGGAGTGTGAAAAGAAAGAARPAIWVLPAPGHAPGAVRWGVVHVPSGRWMAFGDGARCRQLVAHLTAVDAILTRPGAAAAAGGGPRRPPPTGR
jgi:hypothetical protein